MLRILTGAGILSSKNAKTVLLTLIIPCFVLFVSSVVSISLAASLFESSQLPKPMLRPFDFFQDVGGTILE